MNIIKKAGLNELSCKLHKKNLPLGIGEKYIV